jgi:hypothetical protein
MRLMPGQSIWIAKGRVVAELASEPAALEEDHLIQRSGFVRVHIEQNRTEVKWAVFAPNWASLYCVMDRLPSYPAPYTLKYFASGWCEEIFDDPKVAAERIEEILAKSDVHITSRFFVKEVDPGKTRVPSLLRDALVDHSVGPEYAVDCVFDQHLGRFCVERVGSRSAIAQIWGLSPSSYACQSGHTYDQMVSVAYKKVLKSGEPHYDHVMASMITPDKVPLWVPYQRVVLPHRFPDGRPGVTVVSQLGYVDIKLL